MNRIFHWFFMRKMNPMSGCDIRLVFTLPPRDSTLQYKRCVHLWNNFPYITPLTGITFLWDKFHRILRQKPLNYIKRHFYWKKNFVNHQIFRLNIYNLLFEWQKNERRNSYKYPVISRFERVNMITLKY